MLYIAGTLQALRRSSKTQSTLLSDDVAECSRNNGKRKDQESFTEKIIFKSRKRNALFGRISEGGKKKRRTCISSRNNRMWKSIEV